VAALSSVFCSVVRSVSRAENAWPSAWRVRLAVWKPLNSVWVAVRPKVVRRRRRFWYR
jgi:hypothetical protein